MTAVNLVDRLLRPAAAPAPLRARRLWDRARRDLRAALALATGTHAAPTIARTSGRATARGDSESSTAAAGPGAAAARASAMAASTGTVTARATAAAAPHTAAAPHAGAAAEPRAGAAATARELTVVEVRRETTDAVTLVLADPTGAPIRFRPGQFFTLLVDAGGETLRRAYSASSSPTDATRVAITVKRVAGGRVSNLINDTARPGDRLRALGPSGDFGVALDPAAARHLLLVGGGSGITPLMAIARGVLAVEPASRVTLIYGNRRADDVIFAAELAALAAAHPALRVHHVLEESPADAAAIDRAAADAAADGDHARPDHATARGVPAIGRLDEPTCARVLAAALADAPPPAACFVCGPEPMMAAARAALLARGVDATAIHEERFASLRTPGAVPAATGAATATVRTRGGTRTVVVAPGQTLLDAGLDAGVAMPFSCGMGGCGACAVTLVAGAVDLDEPNCLAPAERAAGRILACVARPRGACTIAVAPDDGEGAPT